jgi:adenylate cyclase
MVEACRVMGITLYFLGDFTAALGIMEQGIALYDPEKHHSPGLFVTDPGVNLLTWSALILWLSGYPGRSSRRINEMLALAERLSHPPTLALAHAFAAIAHQMRREGHVAKKHAEEAISFKISTYVAIGAMLRGWALAELGQLQNGQALLTQALAGYQASGTSFGEPYFLALLVEIYRNTGQYGQALHTLEEAFRVMSKHGERWPEAELLRLKGEMLLLHDAAQDEAEEYFHKAIQVAQGQHARLLELRAVVGLSRLWREKGRDEEARQKLAEIYAWFSDGFDTADLREAKALLGELL